MELLENVKTDFTIEDKTVFGELNVADHVRLALANFAAALFPTVNVFVNPQQQGVIEPAIFISFYNIQSRQLLATTNLYDFNFTISYWCKDKLSTTEPMNVIFILLQNLYKVPSDIGELVIYNKESDITDGIANITGTITAMEIDIEKEVKMQELEVERGVKMQELEQEGTT